MNYSEMSIQQAEHLLKSENLLFKEIFKQGSLNVEFYKPKIKDEQTPHSRDEIYVIAKGQGLFFNEGKRLPFSAGDFLFVAAGSEHRFEDFSDDFCTWVFFF